MPQHPNPIHCPHQQVPVHRCPHLLSVVLNASGFPSRQGMLLSSLVLNFFTAGLWAVTYTHTPEVFPTHVRTTCMGVCSCVARVAGIIVSLMGGFLLSISVEVSISLIVGTLPDYPECCCGASPISHEQASFSALSALIISTLSAMYSLVHDETMHSITSLLRCGGKIIDHSFAVNLTPTRRQALAMSYAVALNPKPNTPTGFGYELCRGIRLRRRLVIRDNRGHERERSVGHKYPRGGRRRSLQR